MAEPQKPEPQKPMPSPFTWNARRVGTNTLPSGDSVVVVAVTLATVVGQITVFMSGPEACRLADDLRSAAGALVVTPDMPLDPFTDGPTS